jgi:hypothetical protein
MLLAVECALVIACGVLAYKATGLILFGLRKP